MNKEEFIKKLRKSLDILEDKEISDIVSEYEGYIEEKVKDGKSEEEAVKELGDFNEIVSDLLAAYKVKSPKKEEGAFTRFINSLSDGLDNFMNSLNEKSGKDILKIIIEIIIILFIVTLLKIPFSMIKELVNDIFSELGYPIGRMFTAIWSFIIELSYVITSVIFFIKMLEKRYFSGLTDEIVNKVENKEDDDNEPIIKKPKPEKPKDEKEKPIKETKKDKVVEVKTSRRPSFISFIADVCIIFLKFIVIMFVMGVVCYLIGMSIATGLAIYLIAKGVGYFGVFILILTMFFAGAFVLELCISFIFNRKITALPTFSKLISLIILTGVGLTLSAIEIAKTEIIYDNNYTETKSITKELTMNKDLTFYNYDSIVTDNNLGDRIVIEYIYPSMDNSVNLEIDLENCGKGYCLYADFNHVAWNSKVLNTVIENLKNKKFYVYDFNIQKVIHASEANAALITNNHKHNYYYDNDPLIFTKTYHVNNIIDKNDNLYLYLTLQTLDFEESSTIKIPRYLAKDII
ncbi:MAG: DUF1700 domain-containing protein, partial [Ruminococcus sp.]|nr:DUF1700 domain-containing protein [Ruminococcus sp.]